jgi:hypothetical protein
MNFVCLKRNINQFSYKQITIYFCYEKKYLPSLTQKDISKNPLLEYPYATKFQLKKTMSDEVNIKVLQ